MLKLFIFSTIIYSVLLASAKDFTAQDIRDRLEVKADIYLTDASGERILSGPQRTNYWRVNPEKGTIDGDWSSKFDEGLIALRQNWSVKNDGTIHVSMEEFAKDSEKRENPILTQSLEKKEFILKNLEPIVWKVKNIKDQKYIVRFVPFLREISTPISFETLPVAGTKISISDNIGYLWAEGVQFSGRYTGVISHRGAIIISYSPFNGSREMGYAEGNQITLNVDKNYQINLKSETSFLPAGLTAKVYAYYNPDKKTKGFNSLNTFDTNKEDRLKKDIFKK